MGPSFDCIISHINEGKRICNYYDGSAIPFYGCLFAWFKFMIPFTIFKKDLLDNLEISPSEFLMFV